MAAEDAIVDKELGVAQTKYTRPEFIEETEDFADFHIPGLKESVQCPGCFPRYISFSVKTIIFCLNDNHHWTREDIADWLDTLPVDLTIKEN